jgi:hypothetical protein
MNKGHTYRAEGVLKSPTKLCQIEPRRVDKTSPQPPPPVAPDNSDSHYKYKRKVSVS